MVQWLRVSPRLNPQTRQMELPKANEPEEWVRVSGRWLPKSLVDNWKDSVSAAKGQLGAAMPLASSGLAVAIPYVSSLANAKSQQEFNVALQQIAGTLQGMGGGAGMPGMQDGGQLGGQPGGQPGGGRPGRSILNGQ